MEFNPTHICIAKSYNIPAANTMPQFGDYIMIEEEPTQYYINDARFRYFTEHTMHIQYRFLSRSFIEQNFRKLTETEKTAFKYKI